MPKICDEVDDFHDKENQKRKIIITKYSEFSFTKNSENITSFIFLFHQKTRGIIQAVAS